MVSNIHSCKADAQTLQLNTTCCDSTPVPTAHRSCTWLLRFLSGCHLMSRSLNILQRKTSKEPCNTLGCTPLGLIFTHVPPASPVWTDPPLAAMAARAQRPHCQGWEEPSFTLGFDVKQRKLERAMFVHIVFPESYSHASCFHPGPSFDFAGR